MDITCKTWIVVTGLRLGVLFKFTSEKKSKKQKLFRAMADHRMSICAVSPQSKFGLRRPSSNYKSLIRISVCVGSIIIVMASALILSSKSEHKSFLDIKESFLEGKNIARSPRLFSWVNSFDDGKGVTTAGQHGGTQIISGCDAGSKNVIIETIKLTENG